MTVEVLLDDDVSNFLQMNGRISVLEKRLSVPIPTNRIRRILVPSGAITRLQDSYPNMYFTPIETDLKREK